VDLDLLLRRFDDAKAARANFESMWQDIADRVIPSMADFTTTRAPGERRTEKMLDSTAALTLQRALAAVTAFFWPSNQRYQQLTDDEDDEEKVPLEVKAWLEALTKDLFRTRYSPAASFEAQMSEVGLSFLGFGTGVMFIDDMLRNPALRRPGVLYKSIPLSQAYLQENAAGRIDTLHRRWPWSLRQIEQRFPGMLPDKLRRDYERQPDRTIDVCQTVCPRADYDPSYDPQRPGGLGMPWASCYFLPDAKVCLSEGGFRTWPFAVMRYMTASGEIYGRSPAWLTMSNIRTLNTMKRTILAAAQKVADPPLLATEDGVLGVFNQAPGALNMGGLDDTGNPLVKPLMTGAKVEIGLDMMDKEREIIASANFLDVFKALIDNPQMTATQALELLQERANLMAPIGGRIESEGLGPMTERELDIMGEGGRFADMPPELIARGGRYKIAYTSPMRRAMRTSEALAITRTFEQVIPLAETDPSALDAFDVPGSARELGEINGFPAKLMRSLEDIQAKADQRASQQNAQTIVQAAPQISQAAANLTKMQAAGGRPQL